MSFLYNDDGNNWLNNLYHETFAPVDEPTGPIWQDPGPNPYPNGPVWQDPGPDPYPNDPWIMWENQQNSTTNPLMALLGVQTNNNGNIPKTQQKRVKSQYPALSNIFGTKAQSNLGVMYEDGDGSDGGDDEPVYPDDDGTIHGGVEYPGGDDPEPVDYPDWYPDPDEPDEPSGGNSKPYNHPTLFGSILNTVLSQTLGITFNSAQQAAYYRGNDQTHSSDYKDSVQQLKTSINALNETHKIQQKNLDKMLNNVTSAKNQHDYSQNLKAYTQLREQAQSTQNLATRIQYAADNHDYQNVATEVQNYTIPDPPSTAPAPTMSDLDQNDWRYEHNTQLQAGLEKSFGSSSNTQPQYYFKQQANYNTTPVQNYAPYQQAPEHNFGTSDFPVFHLGVANSNSTVPLEITNPTSSNSSPDEITEAGEVMSAGATVTDFMENLNRIPEIDSNVIKQAFATYQGQTGQKIQVELQAQLQAGIEKIAQECVDSAKAFKIATEISEKVAPILTFAYIAQQFIQGFQNKGVWNGVARAFVASLESGIANAVFGVLIGTELTILPAATITLLASIIIEHLLEQVLNHFKL